MSRPYVFREVNPECDIETLWAQTGLFSLKDVVKILGTDTVIIRRQFAKLKHEGHDPWESMGVSNWAAGTYVVDLQRFKKWWASFPKKNPNPPPIAEEIPEGLSTSKIFDLGGVYPLKQIQSLPIPMRSLKNLIRKSECPEKEIGVWCVGKKFYVRMPTFRAYLSQKVPYFDNFLSRN
ncbi:MAG: hypothetical protein KDC71_22740 [Acidobacteria bacterium]|nr:hypothetical protein [Acidobacteriota bacterium]